MKSMQQQQNTSTAIENQKASLVSNLAIDPSQIDNAVLRRLISEVQFEKKQGDVSAYNRTHNRHNRGR